MMKIIKEFSEFNHQRLNNDSVPQSTHVDNPELSIGSLNKYEQNLRTSLNRLNDLFKTVSLTTTGVNLKTGSTVEASDIKNIKILRIFPKDDIYLNVYFTFELGDEKKPYYGVIKKINHSDAEVYCEIFNDRSIFTSKEWVIRIKGNIIKAIKKWLNVPSIEYKSLKDIDVYNESTGELTLIPSGEIIKVRRSVDNSISISWMGGNYNIIGRNYYYFNYYFALME